MMIETHGNGPQRLYTDLLVQEVIADQRRRVAELTTLGITPNLAVLLPVDASGNTHGPSAGYVRRKAEHGALIGAKSCTLQVARREITSTIFTINDDPDIHGQMLQLPLPVHHKEDAHTLKRSVDRKVRHIAPHKDVDGLRPPSMFEIASDYPAATPGAIMFALKQQDRVPLSANVRAAIIGSEGRLVGSHLGPLLRRAGVVDIINHDKQLYPDASPDELTERLRVVLKAADVVISCVGIEGLIKPNMLHDGMVVIDAGVTSVEVDGVMRLRGDLDPSIADSDLDILYTGPTRGIGPLTVCQLWEHTITAATRAAALSR